MGFKFLESFKEGLNKTRREFKDAIDNLFRSKNLIDEELYEELTSILVRADVGVKQSQDIMMRIKVNAKTKGIKNPQELKLLLKDEMLISLSNSRVPLSIDPNGLSVFLTVGVNGTGKTTTIAKLAYRFKNLQKKVMLAACDTFRAAAVDQLEILGKKAGASVFKQKEGADPAAVAFDAVSKAKSNNYDILIVDTKGMLHTKVNLMEELKKIKRVINKNLSKTLQETLLILDATVGQNGILQAKSFTEAVDVTGIVLTKIDGTAKGGIVIPITSELNIPIKLLGVGEKLEDLVDFNPEAFVDAIFGGER